METENKNFIDRLQQLDEPMKRRVLVVATLVAMVVVVYIWIGYFNSIVMNNPVQLADQSAAAQPSTAAATAGTSQTATGSAQTDPSAPSFWQMLGGGFTSLYHSMAKAFQAPGQYNITPTQMPVTQQ